MFNNMKKTYTKPACEVVEIKIESNLLQASEVQGNVGLGMGGSGDYNPRARRVVGVDWDEWEE